MMLYYKMWRESRGRFLLCAATLFFLCMVTITRARTGFPPPELPQLPYSMWVWAGNYGNISPVVFVVVSLLLGLGGLQRERAYGTAAFTLSLPVTRFELVAARAAVGLVQVAVLGVIPVLLVPTLSPPIAGQTYPLSQALQYALLFVTWGTVAFAVGLLTSTLLGGEYTTAALCIFGPIVYRIVVTNTTTLGTTAANYTYFMAGFTAGFDKRTDYLRGPLPWATIAMLAGVAATIMGLAIVVTRRRDF